MPLDPSIILSGQPLNLLGAIQSGNQLAAQANEIRRGNALADLYRTQGQGLMSGDPAALNALAAYDPQAAMQIKAGQQDMANNAETMQMRRDAAKREAETYAAGLADAERKAQADKIEQGVAAGLAAKSPEEWDALVTQFGAPDLKGQFGNRVAIAHSLMGVADALKAVQPADPTKGAPNGYMWADPADPRKGVTQLPGMAPDWRAATPDEAAIYGAAAGQINTKTGEFKDIKPPSGMRVESDGKGGFVFSEGPGVTKGAQGGTVQPSSPEAMLSTINGILQDPALPYSTGILSPLQAVPGTPMKRFQGRANQLNGQAFLQAFQSLKGGGQITEVEGAKATQAIGRLDTAQDPADYTQALTELRDILVKAQTRPVGWAYGQKDPTISQSNAPDVGAVENGYRFKGGSPADPKSWEKVE